MYETPKEEAERLINLFWSHQIFTHCGTDEANVEAKYNAVLAVKLITDALPKEEVIRLTYWNVVKEEIMKHEF